MRYMSKDTRALLAEFPSAPPLLLEALLLWHSLQLVRSHLAPPGEIQSLLGKRTRPDAVTVWILDYADAWMYLCEQYVTTDFNHLDAMKAALIVEQYPLLVIKRVGDKCKALGRFTIPYLATVLESEGAGAIEELRREQRLTELVSQSKPVELPTQRFPGQLRARLHENVINEEIEKQHDDIRRA